MLGTYSRPGFVISHGNGVYLYDTDGKKYLDFVSGIAVNAFGYNDKQTQKALLEQSQRLWHCSNLYYTEPQVQLAELLVKKTFADKVFFCNSGTEAIEAAIKFARKWASATRSKEDFQIITLNRSFHGRTYGALAATGQPKFWENFGPMLTGFEFADFNDLESVKKRISDKTVAVLVEPVQGEGGVYPATQEFLQGLRELCEENNCLLILDEIQCGFGRTGTFCAYEQYGILPDMMTVAKPIAGGLPLGAVLMNDNIASHIKPGDHGTTFGGGPLVTFVAHDILKRISRQSFLDSVKEKSDYIFAQLNELQGKIPDIVSVRGKGLMIGIELSVDPQTVINKCIADGLLICKTGGNAVRFLPPLIVEKKHIDEAVKKFTNVLNKVGKKDAEKS
ncbi:aspartate aminotransferase family protein [candidate division KSB1 bacterium]|nr:aspartate aminotransferase family protein [candidate division KSB1 bacterium]